MQAEGQGLEKAENPEVQARGQGQETAAIQGRKPEVRFRRECRVMRKSRSNKAGSATGSTTGADDKPATCQGTGAGLNRLVRTVILRTGMRRSAVPPRMCAIRWLARLGP